jgi:hypothetical protein
VISILTLLLDTLSQQGNSDLYLEDNFLRYDFAKTEGKYNWGEEVIMLTAPFCQQRGSAGM